MRVAFAAGALCLSLVGIASQPEPPKAPDPSTASAAPPSNEDAVRHAKRTACLKDAKAKKLVGADRSVFVKECIAEPRAAGT
jgi:hypothetical protein